MQQIYDFVNRSANYLFYTMVPDILQIKDRRVYQYFYSDLFPNNERYHGINRMGNFIYGNAQDYLKDFLGAEKSDLLQRLIHINPKTFEIVDYQTFPDWTLYICARIEHDGVCIRVTDPFSIGRHRDIYYHTRSHFTYDDEGIVQDVISYFNKNLYFQDEKKRKLQIKYGIPKEEFDDWYKKHRRRLNVRRKEIKCYKRFWTPDIIKAYKGLSLYQ